MKECSQSVDIVIAFDSFKGCMSSVQANEAAARGVREALPGCTIRCVPVADGGEGTACSLACAGGGKPVSVSTSDPLGRPLEAIYYINEEQGTAFIDVAAADGLTLLRPDERDAMQAGSFGTGLMIHDAAERGCRRICVGLGGSASTDCGTGLLMALGGRFLTDDGPLERGCGAGLAAVRRYDPEEVGKLMKDVEVEALCDVTSPLWGVQGAAAVFAGQKGADRAQIAVLDQGLRNIGQVYAAAGFPVAMQPGAGAAGGVGAAMMTLPRVRIRSGIEAVMEAHRFGEILRRSSLVLTGEGSLDSQSLLGKVPQGILSRALEAGVPVAAFAGRVEDRGALLAAGFASVTAISNPDTPLHISMEPAVAAANLREAVRLHMLRWAGSR